LIEGIDEISWTFGLLANQPKPFFSAPFEEALALCMLPEDCEVAEDERRAVSSSLAFLAFLAPTVSACCGGTSKVGNMATCQCGSTGRQVRGISSPSYLHAEIRMSPSSMIPAHTGLTLALNYWHAFTPNRYRLDSPKWCPACRAQARTLAEMGPFKREL
jgi:hypothetical protein